MHVESFGQTDVGRKRDHNEDSFLCDDDMHLYVVADGVGGHAKGEVASREAIEQIQVWCVGNQDVVRAYEANPNPEGLYHVRRMLESGIQSACYMVHGMAELDPDRKGMSTTVSALLVAGNQVFIGQVGDSRVYLYRKGVALQITEDHTLINYKLKHGMITAEQAAHAKGKNVITRAVGHKDYVQVDVFDMSAQPEDRFMLCSDGLHGYLQPGGVEKGMEGPMDVCAQGFIDFANARGGKDNITVVLVEVS
ncbi:MAG: serine/threonine-protein phosphatase [Deltaproteobacteria bacterium]|nr:serine/threonine-protein phosphatase [Deltaproteobacteria bacterium]